MLTLVCHSIIIGNFSSKTGTAFLTQPQREWIDLQKLITRQKPSKRPSSRPTWAVRAWCYDRAVHKHGWWSRMMTALFVIQIFALMYTNSSHWSRRSSHFLSRTQTFSTQTVADTIRSKHNSMCSRLLSLRNFQTTFSSRSLLFMWLISSSVSSDWAGVASGPMAGIFSILLLVAVVLLQRLLSDSGPADSLYSSSKSFS